MDGRWMAGRWMAGGWQPPRWYQGQTGGEPCVPQQPSQRTSVHLPTHPLPSSPPHGGWQMLPAHVCMHTNAQSAAHLPSQPAAASGPPPFPPPHTYHPHSPGRFVPSPPAGMNLHTLLVEVAGPAR